MSFTGPWLMYIWTESAHGDNTADGLLLPIVRYAPLDHANTWHRSWPAEKAARAHRVTGRVRLSTT